MLLEKSLSQHTKKNIKLVEEMIFSKEDQPGIHSTPAEIAHNLIMIDKDCSGCREKTLFSNSFPLILNFQSFSKFSPSPLHQIFH